jgi:hypothetical protein
LRSEPVSVQPGYVLYFGVEPVGGSSSGGLATNGGGVAILFGDSGPMARPVYSRRPTYIFRLESHWRHGDLKPCHTLFSTPPMRFLTQS